MGVINYNKLFKTVDARKVKTRRSIFDAAVQCMREKKYSEISITELCNVARINRKTFYLHYKSVSEVLDDYELHIVLGLIDIFAERGVITSKHFNVHDQIMLMDELVNENRETFDIIFPLLKSGTFLRKCGTELGKLAFAFMNERPGFFEEFYPVTFVFTVCGIINCYLDWIDFGRQLPIAELAEICERAIEHPLCDILRPETE